MGWEGTDLGFGTCTLHQSLGQLGSVLHPTSVVLPPYAIYISCDMISAFTCVRHRWRLIGQNTARYSNTQCARRVLYGAG